MPTSRRDVVFDSSPVQHELLRTIGRIVTPQQLRSFFNEVTERRGFPAALRFDDFVQALLRDTSYREVLLTSREYRAIKRYAYGEPDPFQLGVFVREGAYLSHGSALELHGLSTPSSAIYVNKEQSQKPPLDLTLSQASIDRAFRGPGRISKYVFEAIGRSFVLLSGKNTKRLQVVSIRTPNGNMVDGTGIERTLIDATVRPLYCGGIENVARAYASAKNRVTAPTLLQTLTLLDYAYPYHQAVGFYLQHAGYPEDELKHVAAMPKTFRFYLGYGMRDMGYSETWKVYYPRELGSVGRKGKPVRSSR